MIDSIRRLTGVTLLPLLLAVVRVSPAFADFDHQLWDELLGSNVVESQGGSVTAVDYQGFLQQRERLQEYLQALSGIAENEFSAWNSAGQLAFLINAYNAWTVELILTEYPEINSIRDIGFLPGAAWRREIVALFGEVISLDELEHEMIRQWPQFEEPRIHFAVNCAAIGCPPLRSEAYEGERLEQQLDSNTRLFLNDRNRNYLQGSTLFVSRIFDWYEEDFEQGWLGVESVAQFLARYAGALDLSARDVDRLLSGEIRIRYLRYDWGLNAISRAVQ